MRAGFSSLKDAAALIDDYPFAFNLVFEGDSLSSPGSPCYEYFPLKAAELIDSYTLGYANVAQSGNRLDAHMLTQGATEVDPLYDAGYEHNIALIWGGTNDYYQGPRTAEQIYSDLESWCNARTLAGFETVVVTLHPQVDSGYEAMRADLNAMLRADHSFCDALADSGDDPSFGTPGNATMYVDNLHLSQAGCELVAPYVKDAIIGL